MRLDKFLVDCGVGSRTEVKQLLKQKKIAVNGKNETAGKLQIDPDKDQVTFMGEDLVHETFVYYLLNKPAGVISATEDDHHQTVLDLLDETSASSYVEIEIAEGKFHQVKRMVAACGKEVVDLERISMGPLTLDPTLQLGEWRRLQPSELKSLEVFGVPL